MSEMKWNLVEGSFASKALPSRCFRSMCVALERGKTTPRQALLKALVEIHYERNEVEFSRGKFRVKGATVEMFPIYVRGVGTGENDAASGAPEGLSRDPL